MLNTSSKPDPANALLSTTSHQNVITAAKGGGIVFVGYLFQGGFRFLTGLLLARFLGAEQLGLTNLAMTAGSLASALVLLGLPGAMVRYVSIYTSRRDTAGLWGTLQIGLGLASFLGVLAGFSLCIFADPIAIQLFHEPRLAPLLRMISLLVPFLTVNNIIVNAIQGFKKMEYVTLGRDIPQPIIRLILIVILAILMGLDATKALITYIISIIINFFMLSYLLNKLFSLKRPLKMGRRNIGEIIRFALPLYLTTLISTFSGSIKMILLGALNTIANAGIFGVAGQISGVGDVFLQSITTISSPIIAELHDRGDRQQLGHFYQTMSKWVFTINLPFFLVVLLFPIPILLIFGKSFTDGAMALCLIAGSRLVDAGTGIGGNVLDMTGKTSLKLVNTIASVIFSIGLSVLLIPRWGLEGAAFATLMGVTIINLLRLSEVFILYRLLPYNLGFIKPLVAGLVALVVGWGMRLLLFPEKSLIYLGVDITIVGVVYAGMILLLGLSPEDRTVLNRVSQRMRTVLPRWIAEQL